MDLDAPEDKFVANSHPKTAQKTQFSWKHMPMKVILLLTFFLNDPVFSSSWAVKLGSISLQPKICLQNIPKQDLPALATLVWESFPNRSVISVGTYINLSGIYPGSPATLAGESFERRSVGELSPGRFIHHRIGQSAGQRPRN